MTAKRARSGPDGRRGDGVEALPLDVLAIGAHPDDVELGCGGTLALLAERGARTGIVHLTSGEAGTRGSAQERRREAAAAAAALGAGVLEILDCGDGGLRTGRAEEDALIAVLRRLRPRLVLGPPPSDRHPDHGRAHRLVRDACFYAGLARRPAAQLAAEGVARAGAEAQQAATARSARTAGPRSSAEESSNSSPPGGTLAPHRPEALFCYLQHDLAVPTFVVDVTSAWPRKMAALDAYASQLWREPGGDRRTAPEKSPALGAAGGGGEQLACSPKRAEASSAPTPEANRAGQPTAPPTLVASREFRLAVEGRARDLGLLIGAAHGEGFLALGPLAVADPLDLLRRGLR